MTVSTYFEYYLTMLGWVVSNSIWYVLVETGIILIPIVAIFIGSFIEVRQQSGEDNVEAVVKNAETRLWVVYVVIMFACIPWSAPRLGELKLDTGSSCGVSQIAHDETRWGGELETIGHLTPKVPLWWALVHILSKGITHTAIASMPCSPDVRSSSLEIQNLRIADPNLLAEVGEFTYQCYADARAKLLADRSATESWNPLTNTGGMMAKYESSWIGSKIFLNESGYYDSIQAKTPQAQFPYTIPRDEGYARGLDGGGYPTCKEWWQDSSNGLRARLEDQIEPTMVDRANGVFARLMPGGLTDTTDAMIRSLVSPVNTARSGDTSQMFSTQAKSTRGGAGGAVAWVRDSAQNFIGNWSHYGPLGGERFRAEAANHSLKHTLEMFQAIAYFVLVVTLPLILVFSGFSLQAIIAASMGMFTVHFLSFWWEVARWMDSKLLAGMYMNGGVTSHVSRYIPGTDHSTGYWLAEMVLWASMIGMPMLFMMFMAWAGIRTAGGITNTMAARGIGATAAAATGAKFASGAGAAAKSAGQAGAKYGGQAAREGFKRTAAGAARRRLNR